MSGAAQGPSSPRLGPEQIIKKGTQSRRRRFMVQMSLLFSEGSCCQAPELNLRVESKAEEKVEGDRSA